MGLFDSPGIKSVPETSQQQTISPYAQPYVQDLLGKAQAFTGAPMPEYEGQLTAGYSPLQQEAWSGLANLTLPQSLQTAGTALQDISQKQQALSFTPVNFTDTYTAPAPYQGITAVNQYTPTGGYAPSQITSQYAAPTPYAAGQFQNQYIAPEAYAAREFTNQYVAPTTYAPSQIKSEYMSPQAYQGREVTTGIFTPEVAQRYMNPYIQASLEPQLREARRQSDITAAQNAARMAQSGAFGGSRQAMVEAELQKNLGQRLADITGTGYSQAYEQAAQQFQADQARALQAQQANVQQAQFAAQQGMQDAEMVARFGMTAAQANEASRQFGAQQAQQAAQLQAQYGLSAQQASEASRQFGAQQAQQAAQLSAQYGLSADQARELSRQFGAGQAAQAADLMAKYGMTAQQANEASRQFAQQQALQNAANLAQFGTAAQAANIQQGQFGYTQGMEAARQEAQALQQQQAAQQAARQFGATYGLQGLQAAASAQQAAANAGASAAQYGLANLQALSRAGTEQQALDQAALNAQYNEYLRQLQYPQTMLKLQRDVLSGLPVTTTNTYEAQKSIAQSAAGAADTVMGMIDKFKKIGMSMPDISKYINQLTKTNPAQTGGITVDESGNLIYPSAPGGGTPYDDEGNLNPGWGLDENNNPVWVSTDYVEPSYDYYDYGGDYGYTNPDNNTYQDWWDTESYD